MSPAASSHACRSAHAAAGTAVVLGPKMAAVLCASGVLRSSSKPPPPAALGLRVTGDAQLELARHADPIGRHDRQC